MEFQDVEDAEFLIQRSTSTACIECALQVKSHKGHK
jgi:hypothetical protein